MQIPIEIESHDRRLGFEIAGVGNSLTSGTVVDLPGGAKLLYRGSLIRKAFGIPEVLQFVLDASINLELSLVGAWLYDKVKGKEVERIIVNRRVITEITPDSIRQVLEEEIRSNGA
jgi:hypothetical protein